MKWFTQSLEPSAGPTRNALMNTVSLWAQTPHELMGKKPMKTISLGLNRPISDIAVQSLSDVWLSETPWIEATSLLCPWYFPGKNTGVGCHFLLQEIFPTQRLNQRLMHWEVVVQSLSRVQLFATSWTATNQASLSFTISQSLLKFLSIESVMPSNYLTCHPLSSIFSSCPQSFPASGSFPMSQLFTSDCQSTGASASASALPMNIQDWFPLGLTCLISLLSNGLSRVFSNTTVQKHQLFGTQAFLMVQLPHMYMTTRKTIALTIWTFVGKVIFLFNTLSRCVIAFLTRSSVR